MRNVYRACIPFADGAQCSVHGGEYSLDTRRCQTLDVLDDVRAERARQFAQYGTNDDLEDGTGGSWLVPFTREGAAGIEKSLRRGYEAYETNHGTITWMHLVREEVAEAFAEQDPETLRAEVLQIAALCVSWVEKLDARPEANTTK